MSSITLPKSFQPIQSEDQAQKPKLPASFQPIQEQPQENDELDYNIEQVGPRHVARLASRGAEQIVGAPGNMRDFAYYLKDLYKKEKHVPKFLQLPENIEKFDEKNISSEAKDTYPLFGMVGQFLDYFPTSSEVKKFSEEKTGGYTKPENEYERLGDEIFENIVAASIPGSGQRTVWRNIGIPVVSTLSKEGLKYLGGTEKEQAAVQSGSAFILNLLSRGNAKKYKNQLYDDLDANVPNAAVPNGQMMRRLDSLETSLKEGLEAPSEKAVLKVIDDLKEKLSKGFMTAKEAVASKRSLNEIRGDPALLKRGKTLLNEVSDILDDGAKLFKVHQPEFYKKWKTASEVFGAIEQSNFTANMIQKYVTKPYLSEGMNHLFSGAVGASAATAGAIPPIYAIYKGIQVANRIGKSPVLSRYYANVVKASAQGNVAVMASSLEKLDKALADEEKRKPPFKLQSQQRTKQSATKKQPLQPVK